MSFLMKQTIKYDKTDPLTGIVLGTAIEELEVLCSITEVKIDGKNNAIGFFTMENPQSSLIVNQSYFTYVHDVKKGDVIEEAESLLLKHLNN